MVINEWMIVIINKDIVLWRNIQQVCIDKTILGGDWSYQPWWKSKFKTWWSFFRIWISGYLKERVNLIVFYSMRSRNKIIHRYKVQLKRE